MQDTNPLSNSKWTRFLLTLLHYSCLVGSLAFEKQIILLFSIFVATATKTNKLHFMKSTFHKHVQRNSEMQTKSSSFAFLWYVEMFIIFICTNDNNQDIQLLKYRNVQICSMGPTSTKSFHQKFCENF